MPVIRHLSIPERKEKQNTPAGPLMKDEDFGLDVVQCNPFRLRHGLFIREVWVPAGIMIEILSIAMNYENEGVCHRRHAAARLLSLVLNRAFRPTRGEHHDSDRATEARCR
jgi:hypothetical protein